MSLSINNLSFFKTFDSFRNLAGFFSSSPYFLDQDPDEREEYFAQMAELSQSDALYFFNCN